MGLIWFMIVIILFAMAIGASIEMSEIAKMKGHDGTKYFWWSLLFFPFGAAMVIALPDRGNKQEVANVPNDELPDL